MNERRAKAAQRTVVTIGDIAARLDDVAGAIQDREFLDQLATMVENHNRKMSLPLLDRQTKLIRRLAAATGKDKATFRALFNARVKLLDQQRHGNGDPEELSAATKTMLGTANLTDEVRKLLEEANRTVLRLMYSKIRDQQEPAEDAKLEDAQPPQSVERRSGGFLGRVRGMNNYVKMAIIIGISIILAVAIDAYFSPFQTCKREVESSSDYRKHANAAAYCARALGRGFR